MQSAESGKQFLVKNHNHVDEIGVDPSSLQVIVLEDRVVRSLEASSIQFEPNLFGSNQLYNRQIEK